MERVLVVCIGNSLVADDAVGCAVHEKLAAEDLPDAVRLELLAVGGIRLLDDVRSEPTLIVVDAVQLGAPPGTIHVLDWDDIPTTEGLPVTSHGIGVKEAIEIGRILYPERMPKRIVVVGIEGCCFNRFSGMTPEVASAVLPATAEIRRQIDATIS